MPEEVTYLSQGIKIAAKLYFLQDSSEKKCAVIVASHPGGGCKEQTAAIYAERLAQLGFITLTFNAAYQGAKGDEPYYLEDPSQRAEDIKDTVTYLSTLTQVEPERVGVLGFCASSTYVSYASPTDVRIKAAAEGFHGSSPLEALQQTLAEAGKERIYKAKVEAPRIDPIVPAKEIIDTLPTRSLFKEAYDYYCTPRAQHASAPQSLLVYDF